MYTYIYAHFRGLWVHFGCFVLQELCKYCNKLNFQASWEPLQYEAKTRQNLEVLWAARMEPYTSIDSGSLSDIASVQQPHIDEVSVTWSPISGSLQDDVVQHPALSESA